MPDRVRLTELLNRLFASQRSAVLATQQRGQPYCSLMAFAATGDLKLLLFATLRETRKYANLASDPRAAMLIDNRTNQAADTENAVAATATGRAIEVDPAEREQLLGIFLARHPHLQSFVSHPGCALLKLQVTEYYVVERFQEVQVLPMVPD